ncbi:MAG TPA: MFS transporter, partial [Anaerolineaceae bacterium]|nr:MFS transporter [Anaerolineaceae bacterium]
SSVAAWAVASVIAYAFGPIINGSNQAIWQSKVAPDVQGRVFSVRRLIAQVTAPLGMLVAGPLADQVFEPFFRQPGTVLGGEAGAGMAVLIILSGALTALIGIAAYMVPHIRNVEALLPDHQQTSET